MQKHNHKHSEINYIFLRLIENFSTRFAFQTIIHDEKIYYIRCMEHMDSDKYMPIFQQNIFVATIYATSLVSLKQEQIQSY